MGKIKDCWDFPAQYGFHGGTPVRGYMRGGRVSNPKGLVKAPQSGPVKGSAPSSHRPPAPSKTPSTKHPYAKGGMHINPANKGKFTARHIGVEKGLKSESPLVRKEANFARMAKRHFKPLAKGGSFEKPPEKQEACGGLIKKASGGPMGMPRAPMLGMKRVRHAPGNKQMPGLPGMKPVGSAPLGMGGTKVLKRGGKV